MLKARYVTNFISTLALITTLVQRVDAARSRIESLNPLVSVETISDVDSLDWDALVKRCDIVCLTDGSSQEIVSL